MKPPRIMLADDHKLLVEAFRKLLEPHYDVVGTVSDGCALVKSALLLKPDVVVIDIAMPLLNGLDAGRQLKLMMPSIKLVFLTMNHDSDLAAEAMRMGASAYLLKSSAASELFQAIEEALKGRSYVTQQIASGMQESFIRDPRPKNERSQVPTPRQREVIKLLAEGKTMKQAAHLLKVTPRTIAFHKYNLMDVMGLKTNADLVQYAVKNNIIAT
jgi:DNA-binding NarL/FixJ family response regulator